MTGLLTTISSVLLISGCIVLLIGAIGLVRFPEFFTRLHAASVIDTLGLMLVCAGLMINAGFTMVTIKLVLMFFFIIFTSPTAAHALAKSALHGKLQPQLHQGGEPSSK